MQEPEEEQSAVDRFIDDRTQDNYARWCLLLMRFPSSYLADFKDQLDKNKLYCMYKGKWYLVVHASPHGYIKIQTGVPGESRTVSPFECDGWDAIEPLPPMNAIARVGDVVKGGALPTTSFSGTIEVGGGGKVKV